MWRPHFTKPSTLLLFMPLFLFDEVTHTTIFTFFLSLWAASVQCHCRSAAYEATAAWQQHEHQRGCFQPVIKAESDAEAGPGPEPEPDSSEPKQQPGRAEPEHQRHLQKKLLHRQQNSSSTQGMWVSSVRKSREHMWVTHMCGCISDTISEKSENC